MKKYNCPTVGKIKLTKATAAQLTAAADSLKKKPVKGITPLDYIRYIIALATLCDKQLQAAIKAKKTAPANLTITASAADIAKIAYCGQRAQYNGANKIKKLIEAGRGCAVLDVTGKKYKLQLNVTFADYTGGYIVIKWADIFKIKRLSRQALLLYLTVTGYSISDIGYKADISKLCNNIGIADDRHRIDRLREVAKSLKQAAIISGYVISGGYVTIR